MVKTRTGTIATDFQFLFYFQLSLNLPWSFTKQKMDIVHSHTSVLRIDGSILAGVFLTSSFCVVPESSGYSNAASSSLFVHVELVTRTTLVQLIVLCQQCTASNLSNTHIL